MITRPEIETISKTNNAEQPNSKEDIIYFDILIENISLHYIPSNHTNRYAYDGVN